MNTSLSRSTSCRVWTYFLQFYKTGHYSFFDVAGRGRILLLERKRHNICSKLFSCYTSWGIENLHAIQPSTWRRHHCDSITLSSLWLHFALLPRLRAWKGCSLTIWTAFVRNCTEADRNTTQTSSIMTLVSRPTPCDRLACHAPLLLSPQSQMTAKTDSPL